MTLEELKSEERRLYDLIKQNNEAQRELTKKAFIEKWGADVGDWIEYKNGNSPDYNVGVVKEIQFDELHRPRTYIVYLTDKEGKLTKKYMRVWMQSENPIRVINKP